MFIIYKYQKFSHFYLLLYQGYNNIVNIFKYFSLCFLKNIIICRFVSFVYYF